MEAFEEDMKIYFTNKTYNGNEFSVDQLTRIVDLTNLLSIKKSFYENDSSNWLAVLWKLMHNIYLMQQIWLASHGC